MVICGLGWERLTNFSRLGHFIRADWLSAEETAKYYSGAKIVINIHRQSDDSTLNLNHAGIEGVSVNNRTFEIAACGTFQLIDYRTGVDKHYLPGIHLDIFTNADQLRLMLDYYLEQRRLRNEYAKNALEWTRKEHTFERRIAEMLSILHRPD